MPLQQTKKKAHKPVSEKKPSEDLFQVSAELESDGLSFGSFDDPYQFLKQAIRTEPAHSAIRFARNLTKKLDPQAKEELLLALIERAVCREDKKVSATAGMDELRPNLKPGEYPYLHAYNRALYARQIRLLQIELLKLQNWVQKEGKKLVVIFEGRDAAGKGGTIQRFIEHLNPRAVRIAALPKPTSQEAGQWYFQRYVSHLPTKGEMVFFDRSWYNRAVVEPVMGFCTQQEYETFMKEVPSFERNIISEGTILFKFWLDVTQKEQKRRFKQRRTDPLKQWKLSPVDLASLSKWDEYTQAINQMFFNTDTAYAPWTIIESDDKMRARINAIRVVLSNIDYEGRDLSVIGEVDPRIVFRANARSSSSLSSPETPLEPPAEDDFFGGKAEEKAVVKAEKKKK